MRGDPPTVRRAVRNDDPDSHPAIRGNGPAHLLSDGTSQTPLPVDRADELIHVRDVGFQLDDQQHPRGSVVAKDVDHAAFAADRERHLGSDEPARKIAERPGDLFMEPRVVGVQQPVQVAGAPPAEDIDPHVERGRDAPQRRHRERVEMAPLDPRDRRRRDSRLARDVDLPERPTDPNGPKGAAQPLIAHGRTVACGPHPPVCLRLHPTQLTPVDRWGGSGARATSLASRPKHAHAALWARIAPRNRPNAPRMQVWSTLDQMFYSSEEQTIHRKRRVAHQEVAARPPSRDDLSTLAGRLSTHAVAARKRNI